MSSTHVGYLDGWRGLGIAGVLIAHFFPVPGIDSGRLGVDLFFVLSGLLMSKILYERRVPLGEFYRRRISRVMPAFCAFVVVVFTVAAARAIQFDVGEFLATLTFLRTYFGESIWASQLPIGHLWSLNVEEHSYVLLATLTMIPLFAGRERYALGVLVLGTLVANLYWARQPLVDADLRTECAATCILASACYRTIAPRFNPAPWLPLAALLLGAACYIYGSHWTLRPLVAPFLLAYAVNHIAASAWLQSVLEFSWLRMLGLWSFSLYLWQQPFYKMKHSLPWGLAFGLAIVFGLASFYFLEQPVRRWLNLHWTGKPVIRTASP